MLTNERRVSRLVCMGVTVIAASRSGHTGVGTIGFKNNNFIVIKVRFQKTTSKGSWED